MAFGNATMTDIAGAAGDLRQQHAFAANADAGLWASGGGANTALVELQL